MQYLKNLLGSFTSPAVYQEFITSPTRRALGHFALSMILISALHSFFLVQKMYPRFLAGLEENTDALIDAYPADLTITWDGQQLTTEPAKYHLLLLDPATLPLFRSEGSVGNETLVYLNEDLTAQEASEAMSSYKASAVVDQHSLFYSTEETGLNEEALGEYLGDRHFAVTRELLPTLRNAALEAATRVQPLILWLGPVVLALLFFVVQFCTSLVFATLLFLPAKLFGALESWTQSWRLTLVVLVVVQLITLAVSFLYPTTSFPVHTAAFWLLSAFILLAIRMGKQQTLSASTKSSRKKTKN